MCNANHHGNDCCCGFGPPYQGGGVVTPVKRYTWLEYAAESRNALYLNAAFDSVIKNKELISEELQDASTVLSDIAEMNLLKRLKNIFKRIRFKTISSKIVKKHIDIFKLHSPNIKGCEVVNKVTDMEMFTNEWILKVFGIGTGAIQTLKVTNSVRYSSTDGHL
jgi:hypothetical protein